VWTFFYGSYINFDVLKEVDLVPESWEVARLGGFDIRIEPRANLVRPTLPMWSGSWPLPGRMDFPSGTWIAWLSSCPDLLRLLTECRLAWALQPLGTDVEHFAETRPVTM
jgi:hypothetical protein